MAVHDNMSFMKEDDAYIHKLLRTRMLFVKIMFLRG